MKKHKKFGLGLGLLLGVIFFLLIGSSKVLAFTQTQVENATFEFVDRSTIRATAVGQTLDFVNSSPLRDGGGGGGIVGGANIKGLYGADESENDGCTAFVSLPSDYSLENLGRFPQVLKTSDIHWKYKDPTGNQGCIEAKVKNPINNADEGARTYFKWVDSGTIETVDSSETYTKGPAGYFLKESEDGKACQDRIFVSGNRGIYFELDKDDGFNKKGFNHEADFGDCKVWGVNFVKYDYAFGGSNEDNLRRLAGIGASIGNTANTTKPPGTGTGGNTAGGTSKDDDVCYKSGWELSWLACPVINAAEQVANALYGFVEDQLRFTVSSNSTTKDSLGTEHDSVQRAWNQFRVGVTGLVVILMLVMIISQAIGAGPFDAYTVKKFMPRLVAGVILIQISWPVFSFLINVIDDTGRGLADLMYAPFGGGDNMTLGKIMQPFNTEGTVFSWVGLGALAIFSFVAPFVVIGLILTVLAALFVGFLTLLFRKIIIILGLIIAPLALICWMVPSEGVRRYWKMWWDNFSKALIMYPLIIALIATGRIFAKIGSGTGGDFIGFFIVLVGFFGPLFLLPKTFKWGGQLMSLGGGALNTFGQKGLTKPKEYLKKAQEGYSAERKLQSQERYAQGYRFNWRRPTSYLRRPVDLVRSGQAAPTKLIAAALGAGRIRQRAMAQYIEQGEKSEKEDVAAAEAQLIRERQRVRANGGNHDRFLQAIADGYFEDEDGNRHNEYIWTDNQGNEQRIGISDRTPMQRRAARTQAAKLGAGTNNRYLEHYFETAQAAGGQEAAEMRKFFDDNTELLIGRMPHIYKSLGQAADAGPAGTAGMHGVEYESVLTQLGMQATGEAVYGRATTPDDQATAPGHIVRFTNNFIAAAENPTLRGNLEGGALRTMYAIATGEMDLIANDQAERQRLGLEVLTPERAASIREAMGDEAAAHITNLLQRQGSSVMVRPDAGGGPEP